MHPVRRIVAIATLITGCSATPPPTVPAAQSSARDTTIVQRGPGTLEFALTLTPLPRRVGDTMWARVSARNFGAESTVVSVPMCYLILRGVRTAPWPLETDVCTAANGEQMLGPGETWGFSEGYKVVEQPGRYRLEIQVAETPNVWLDTELQLTSPGR